MQSVAITKGDQEGRAEFDDKGLSQLSISGTSADKGAARMKDLEATFGKPASTESTTKTVHVDAARATMIELELRDQDGSFTVFETYRPKK